MLRGVTNLSRSYLDQFMPMTIDSRPMDPLAPKLGREKGKGREMGAGLKQTNKQTNKQTKTEQQQCSKEENLFLLTMISESKITQYNTI